MAEILKIREITIDTMQHKDFNVKEEELKLIRFYQNDLNSAKLLINVTHDKVVTDFSSATSVQIAFLKPDCKRVFQDVQNVNQMQGKYYVVLSTQTLIAYGNVIAQLRFTFPNNKVIETCKFAFTVDESIMSDDAMKSTNEFPVIQKAIEAGKKLEGVDIDGIIAAGELAKGALPKTGGTMTGNLRMSKTPASGTSWRSISWDLDNAEAIRMGMNGSNYFVMWDAPQNVIPFEYRPTTKEVRLGSGGSVNILGDTNVVKKSEAFTDIAQPNGDSIIQAKTATDDILQMVLDAGRGIRTIYSAGSAINSPSSAGLRGIANLHGARYGYIIATDYRNKIWTNYINGGDWQGWVNVNGNVKDGRASLTLTADATAGSSNPQLATRRGNTVTLSLDLMRNAGSASAIVTTLPSDMTPVDSYTFDAIATDGTPSRVLIRFNGEIHLDVTGKRYRILATYVCN